MGLLMVCFLGHARDVRGQAEAALFDSSTLHEIRLLMNARDLESLRAQYLENTYYPADLIWRDMRVRNVAIRSRGLATRSPTKLGLLVDFDRYVEGQELLGQRSLVLDNLWLDASMMREHLAMTMFARMGQPAPRTSFARLYINDEYQGLYEIVETIDQPFLARALGDPSGYLFEYHFVAPFYGTFLGDDLQSYKPYFEPRTRELESDSMLYGPIRDLFREVNQADDPVWRERAGQYLDVSQFITHAAVENFLAENDGTLGFAGMANFYLYRSDGTSQHRLLPWDKDSTVLSGGLPDLSAGRRERDVPAGDGTSRAAGPVRVSARAMRTVRQGIPMAEDRDRSGRCTDPPPIRSAGHAQAVHERRLRESDYLPSRVRSRAACVRAQRARAIHSLTQST